MNVEGDPSIVSSGPLTGIGKEDLEMLAQDIRYIRTKENAFKKKGGTFFGSAPFYAMYLSPFFLFIALFFLRNRQLEKSKDVVGIRKRQANKIALKKLKAAKGYMESGDNRSFYDEISRASWNYLGDKMNIELSELSRENIQQNLQSRNASAETIQKLIHLLDNCEMALYAPSALEGSTEDIYNEAISILEKLENEIS